MDIEALKSRIRRATSMLVGESNLRDELLLGMSTRERLSSTERAYNSVSKTVEADQHMLNPFAITPPPTITNTEARVFAWPIHSDDKHARCHDQIRKLVTTVEELQTQLQAHRSRPIEDKCVQTDHDANAVYLHWLEKRVNSLENENLTLRKAKYAPQEAKSEDSTIKLLQEQLKLTSQRCVEVEHSLEASEARITKAIAEKDEFQMKLRQILNILEEKPSVEDILEVLHAPFVPTRGVETVSRERSHSVELEELRQRLDVERKQRLETVAALQKTKSELLMMSERQRTSDARASELQAEVTLWSSVAGQARAAVAHTNAAFEALQQENTLLRRRLAGYGDYVNP